MTRVLIAEDSATSRGLLRAILTADPEIRVVAEACDGTEALELTRERRPDVVTMDIRMPHMDGFEATRRIMIEAPTPIVIVSAIVNPREAGDVMGALRAGALAVLARPAGPLTPGFEEESRRFVATVKAMAQVKVVRRWPDLQPRTPVATPARPAARPDRIHAVAIGASTGGPAALARILGDLPGDFPVPILAVQHMAPGFLGGLAAWLETNSSLRVKVAEAGEPLAPRTVYLAPDDRHLEVAAAGVVRLSDAPPVQGFRPSATPLFESLARVHGRAALALILTGMGQDGLAGLRAVHAAGGRVFAQDEASCVVFGMPGVAVAADLADAVLPPGEMAARLQELV